jgi:hypothetical protein
MSPDVRGNDRAQLPLGNCQQAASSFGFACFCGRAFNHRLCRKGLNANAAMVVSCHQSYRGNLMARKMLLDADGLILLMFSANDDNEIES